MKPESEQFLFQEGKAGSRWISILEELVESLYSSRGKSLEQVKTDQGSASVIEAELLRRLKVQEPSGQKSDYE